MTTKQPLSIRIRPELLEAAKLRAKKRNRSFTNYVETLLEKDLKLKK